jgi:hypothetical protein
MGSSICFSQHWVGLVASLLTLVPLFSKVKQANNNNNNNTSRKAYLRTAYVSTALLRLYQSFYCLILISRRISRLSKLYSKFLEYVLQSLHRSRVYNYLLRIFVVNVMCRNVCHVWRISKFNFTCQGLCPFFAAIKPKTKYNSSAVRHIVILHFKKHFLNASLFCYTSLIYNFRIMRYLPVLLP